MKTFIFFLLISAYIVCVQGLVIRRCTNRCGSVWACPRGSRCELVGGCYSCVQSSIATDTHQCAPVVCSQRCLYGYLYDSLGCQTCTCRDLIG